MSKSLEERAKEISEKSKAKRGLPVVALDKYYPQHKGETWVKLFISDEDYMMASPVKGGYLMPILALNPDWTVDGERLIADQAAALTEAQGKLKAVEDVLKAMVADYVLPTDAPEQRIAMQDGYDLMAEKIRKAIESTGG